MVTLPVLELARSQFGVVARRQLVDDLGLSESAVTRLASDGRLIRMLPATYRLASAPDTFLARAMAVQCWAGTGFLSSWTAARIYGLRRMPAEPIHVTVPDDTRRRVPRWIHLDRSSWYDAQRDRTTLPSGLIVASPLRMLFGLAHDLTARRFGHAAEDAWHLRLTDPDEMADYLELHRCRGKNGVSTMERWLERASGRHRPTQSQLERDVVDALLRVGLPEPELQYPLELRSGETIHLDLAWPAVRLAVEPGASWFHGGDEAQARDHDRDLACNEVGWMIIRLDEAFRLDPEGAARRVRRAHRQRAREVSGPAMPPSAESA